VGEQIGVDLRFVSHAISAATSAIIQVIAGITGHGGE
jgi:hypothetical protein